MIGCCSWQNFNLGKINSLDCRSESHLPANLPSVSHMYTFSIVKRKPHLLLIVSARLSALLMVFLPVPAKGPSSFPLSFSLALFHAVFPSYSLSWHPLALPDSFPYLTFSSSVIVLFWFSISSSHTLHSHLQSSAQELTFIFSNHWLQPMVVTIFIRANVTKINSVRKKNEKKTRPTQANGWHSIWII